MRAVSQVFAAFVSGLAFVCMPAAAATNAWNVVTPPGITPNQVSIDATNPSILYAYTMSPDIKTGSITKSSDGGATWSSVLLSRTASSGTFIFGGVAVASSDSSIVYAFFSETEGGGARIFRSTDSGATWQLRNTGLTVEGLGVVIDPTNASTAYAWTRSNGIFKTTDGGGLWLQVNPKSGPIAIDPTAPNRVYAATFQTISRSTDGGASWQEVSLGLPPGHGADGDVVIDPAHPSTLYVLGGNEGLFKSVDAGASWNVIYSLYFSALRVLPGTTGTVMANAIGPGAIRSLDGGFSWQPANDGLPGWNPGFNSPAAPGVGSLATSPAAPDTAFGSMGTTPAVNGGVFTYTSVPSLLRPACQLTANPSVVTQEGGTTTLSAYCVPAATSYIWSANTGFDTTASGGIVAPAHSLTTYSVQGVNANGSSSPVSVTVTAAAPRMANLSTRARVQATSDVIGGFIIDGPTAKTVVVRAAGPSLAPFGVTDPLLDPKLQLFQGSSPLATNDDWQSASNASALQATGLAPNHPKEPAIMMTLQPDVAYTAVVTGVGGTAGVATVEVFEVDHAETPFINISTRANVLTGNDVMIAGFIIVGNGPKTVVVNVAGPSLTNFFPADQLLANPKLTLVRSSDQAVISINDDWVQSPDAAAIQQAGFAPNNQLEPAILATLPPGAYTAIVEGVNAGTGRAVVGVFALP